MIRYLFARLFARVACRRCGRRVRQTKAIDGVCIRCFRQWRAELR